MFRLLKIDVHYQKSINMRRKVLCFRKLSLDLAIDPSKITSLITIHGCIMTLRKIVYFVFIAWRTYQSWQQSKTKNQHTHRLDLKFGKMHPSVLKITKTMLQRSSNLGSFRSILRRSFSYDESTAGNIKSRKAKKYLKFFMECIQYLTLQGMPSRKSDHINDNLTQFLILWGKDNPAVLERISSASASNKRKYTHQDYQIELITLMANEVKQVYFNKTE